MRGWLVSNGFLGGKKFQELEMLFLEAAKKQDISLTLVKNSELSVVFGNETQVLCSEKLKESWKDLDFVLFWDKDLFLARLFEEMGIPVFNSSKAIEICDDKRKTHRALDKAGIKMPKTVIAPMTYAGIGFQNTDFLELIEKELSYPMIMKEAFGSFGEQVYLVHGREEMIRQIQVCSNVDLLFQEYIESSHGRDVRLQVVGEQVVCGMYRYSETDFRANITAGGKMKKYEPNNQECELALAVARAVGADFAGVDLLFGEQGAFVCEVNSNAHFKNLYDCTGINTADYILKHIKDQVKMR